MAKRLSNKKIMMEIYIRKLKKSTGYGGKIYTILILEIFTENHTKIFWYNSKCYKYKRELKAYLEGAVRAFEFAGVKAKNITLRCHNQVLAKWLSEKWMYCDKPRPRR